MRDVLIHQSLHGYSEGHRLIESSIKLPDDVGRLMLRMSDLSGGSVFPGFEEYLTGYPLSSLSFYVFAKTWYASEMPRPGCVWTHSLILPFKDMDAVLSLARLNKLFVRPNAVESASKSPKVSTSYVESIAFDLDATEGLDSFSETQLRAQLSALVNALYDSNRQNLLIPAPASTTFETSIMRVWAQQWPTLRNNFSFCTGALSSRGFAGKSFDVQCAPPQLIREITTSALAKQSQEMSILNPDEIAHDEKWIDSTVSDAALPNGGRFRKLLWLLAEGSRMGDFKEFASLVAQLLSEDSVSLPQLVALVANRFPDKSAGAALKMFLFCKNGDGMLGFDFSEWEILSELSVSETPGAFNPENLSLRSRANQLCKGFPEDAKLLISKLFNGSVNPLGEEVLAGLLEAMNPEIAKRITAQQPHFLPALFRAKPELGISADLWEAAGDRNRELLEALFSHGDLDSTLISQAVEALLESGSEWYLRKALDHWGKPAVFGALNWMARQRGGLSERSLGAMTFHVKSVAEWVLLDQKRPQEAIITAAHIVAPYTYQFKEMDTGPWVSAFKELLIQGNRRETDYFATMLLALGFQNAPPQPLELVAACFERIHQLVWNNELQDSLWVILEPLVPHLKWMNDWDKCERMRRALIESFVRNNWPVLRISKFISNDQLLSRLLDSAKKVAGGRDLIFSD